MDQLGSLPGPVLGLAVMIILLVALVAFALTAALVEQRRATGAFRARRSPGHRGRAVAPGARRALGA